MTPDISTWPENVRTPVESFLDRVEHALISAGIRRQPRADLLHTLATTLADRLTQQSGATPTTAAVSDTLQEFTGPASVTPPTLSGPAWRAYLRAMKPRRSRCAFWANICIALSLAPLIAMLVVLAFFSPSGLRVEANFPRDRVQAQVGITERETNDTTLLQATGPGGTFRASAAADSPLQRFYWLFAPMSPLALAATLLGILGVVEIARSHGRVRGMAGALFAALFYPLFLGVLTFWLTT